MGLYTIIALKMILMMMGMPCVLVTLSLVAPSHQQLPPQLQSYRMEQALQSEAVLAEPGMGEVFPLLHALEQLLERYRDEGGARKKRSLGDSCSCTPEAPDMLSLLGELRDKL